MFVLWLKESKWTYSKKKKREERKTRKEKQNKRQSEPIPKERKKKRKEKENRKDKVNSLQKRRGSHLTWGRITKKEALPTCAPIYHNNYEGPANGPWRPYSLASFHHVDLSPLVPSQTTYSGQAGVLFTPKVPCTFLLCTQTSRINEIWNVLSTWSDPTNHSCQNPAPFKLPLTSEKHSLFPPGERWSYSL